VQAGAGVVESTIELSRDGQRATRMVFEVALEAL
jgi:hypothetical protein